jgi:hypothetical protein
LEDEQEFQDAEDNREETQRETPQSTLSSVQGVGGQPDESGTEENEPEDGLVVQQQTRPVRTRNRPERYGYD